MSLQQLNSGTSISTGRASDFIDLARFGLRLSDDQSTIIGFRVAEDNEGRFNTYIGYEAAVQSETGIENTFIGFHSGRTADTSGSTFLGARAGELVGRDVENTMLLGNWAGFDMRGRNNVSVGPYSSRILTGSNNVVIGYSNTTESTFTMNSVSLGAFAALSPSGQNMANTMIGSYTRLQGDAFNVISLGSSNVIDESGTFSIVIGNRIDNSGRNSTIIRNWDDALQGFQNTQDGYLNLHDTVIGKTVTREDDDGVERTAYETTVRGENVSLVSLPNGTDLGDVKAHSGNSHVRVADDDVFIRAKRDVDITGDTYITGDLDVTDSFRVGGKFIADLSVIEGSLAINSNVVIEGPVSLSNELTVDSRAFLKGGTAASPALAWMSDHATGLFRPEQDAIGVSVAGDEAVRINDLGHVGIGTGAPSEMLHVEGNSLVAGLSRTSDLHFTSSGTAAYPSLSWANDSDTGIYRAEEDVVVITTGGEKRLQVNQDSIQVFGDFISGSLNATSYAGDGSNIENLDANNVTLGILNVERGGTGSGKHTPNKLLVGNGSNSLLSPPNLHWEMGDATGDGTVDGRLGVNVSSPSAALDVGGDTVVSQDVTALRYMLSDTEPVREFVEDWKTWDAKLTPSSSSIESGADGLTVKDAAYVRAKDIVIVRFDIGFFVPKTTRQVRLLLPDRIVPSTAQPSVPIRLRKLPGENVYSKKTGGKIRFIAAGTCTGHARALVLQEDEEGEQEDEVPILEIALDSFLTGEWEASGTLAFELKPK